MPSNGENPMRALPVLLLALALGACATARPPSALSPADYAAAIADAKRPATDRDRDAARLPAQVLEFAQVAPGEKVGDFMMGGGYFTRLLAAAVGPTGKVYGFTPDEFVAFRPAYATEQDAVVADYANVIKVRSPLTAPAFPEPLDTIITVQNLHDLYIEQMPKGTAAKAISELYGALKPGGMLVVIDHSAPVGSGTALTSKLHRIDRATAVADLTAAGFVLDGSSDLYARPADPRTANVFDPSIRGKTDQFALRFRKPA
jgi:predicted methyltransferase